MWLDALVEMKRESAKTLKQISEESGVSLGTINKIFSGQTEDPKLETIKSIVYCLGFTLDDLEPPSKTKNAPDLTSEAMKIAKQFEKLDERGKETVAYLLEREADRAREIKRRNDQLKMEAAGEIVYFPLSLSIQPVSAGTGAYLGPEEMETIFVQQNDLTKQASFAVKVAGNSMEPEYSDGDILLVEGADDIRVGEIGVFTLDGDGYVKKRGDGELISLNPEYRPIAMNESIWCNGRVIGKLLPEWVQ